MGSSSSKDASTSASRVRRTQSMGSRVFQSSCLGRSSGSYGAENEDLVSVQQNKENGNLNDETCTDQIQSESNQVKRDSCRKVKVEKSNEVQCFSSNDELNEWSQESLTDSVSGAGSSSTQVISPRSLNPSSRFRSRFSFLPGNINFRLSRAASLGSSRSYPLFSTVSSREEEFHMRAGPTSGSSNRDGTRQASDLLSACCVNRLPPSQHEDTSSGPSDPSASAHSVPLQDDEIISRQNVVRSNEGTGILFDVNRHSPRVPPETESIETRHCDRRLGDREPVERGVRFSRTLSVGRLRDRVLRRSSFSDVMFGHREARDDTQVSWIQTREMRTSSSDGNFEALPTSSGQPLSAELNSDYSSHDFEVEASRTRDARYHDMMERRTDFLERRRRIRSQVRALQRLGSRFENLSGHERSCILSGQHRTGRCTCRTSSRTSNPDEDTSARASISRIVMLAEALFEVLDEIHQQSVVLSSRPSVSSIGSVPAPKEVVESMPVKIHRKSQKYETEEAAQCYICLVEYEEGDCMRLLPCHHEFHRICIDKWLKEIHRVCPLCRGDVCRSDGSSIES